MYSLRDYGAMIADVGRFSAYAKAIARAVRSGDTVVDIGCGPGVFSLLACRAGARRVFAIESEDCPAMGDHCQRCQDMAPRGHTAFGVAVACEPNPTYL